MVTGTRFKKTASSFFVINNQNPDDGFVISQKKKSQLVKTIIQILYIKKY